MQDITLDKLDISEWNRVDLDILSYYGISENSSMICIKPDDRGCKIKMAVFFDWEQKVHFVSYSSDDNNDDVFIDEISISRAVAAMPKFTGYVDDFLLANYEAESFLP